MLKVGDAVDVCNCNGDEMIPGEVIHVGDKYLSVLIFDFFSLKFTVDGHRHSHDQFYLYELDGKK